jgi:hypothetical protein
VPDCANEDPFTVTQVSNNNETEIADSIRVSNSFPDIIGFLGQSTYIRIPDEVGIIELEE